MLVVLDVNVSNFLMLSFFLDLEEEGSPIVGAHLRIRFLEDI
jgi:hypothetical protein